MAEKIQKRNIAEACEGYNKIFGANKNLYRIMPNLVDGLDFNLGPCCSDVTLKTPLIAGTSC